MDLNELKKSFRGEVLEDPDSRAAASHDASIFEILPQVVVCPKDSKDIEVLVSWAAEQRRAGDPVSLTARSGGTDMTGGTLSTSVVVDFSKHLNRFLGLEGATATVEPGMYYRDFEKETLKQGLLMPSYPASRELCTVGGMVANNAGGEKTLAYGKTEDYIAELRVVLADGAEHVIRPLGREELAAKMQEKGFEGELYRAVHDLIERNYETIKATKPDVSKNSAGYYLWNVWDKDKKTFDLTRLITGSQGTLGLITRITFRLVQPKPHSLMAVVFLPELSPVADITNELLKFQPESLECYDDKTLKLAIRFFPAILKKVKGNIVKFLWSFWPDLLMLLRHGFPKLVILAEFTGESEDELYTKLKEVERALAAKSFPSRIGKKGRTHKLLVHLTRHQAEEDKYWFTRRESFNLLRQHVKGKHTLPVIDDVIVKPEHMPSFLPELEAILDKYKDKLTSTIAGHNGNGNFHVIPLMDFKDPAARAIVPELMDQVYALTLKYGGSITAEHNDGLVRTPYLKDMYGENMVRLFEEVKQIFDPQGLFNPGKKTGAKAVRDILAYMKKD